MAGGREVADLPAVHGLVVGQAVHAQRHLPERGGLDAFHEAAGDHLVALHAGLAGHLVDFLLADAGGVHIGLVRQVHQVVDHQAVVAGNVVQPAAVGPLGVVGPGQVVDGGGVGLVGVAGPHPDEAVALHHRKAARLGEPLHALAGHGHRLARAFHPQAVVAALQMAFAHRAQRQRRAPVGAEVVQRGDLIGRGTVEHDLLAADGAAQRLVRDLVGRAGYVPGVLGIHGCLSPWVEGVVAVLVYSPGADRGWSSAIVRKRGFSVYIRKP